MQRDNENDLSKNTKQLNAVMIKTIGDLLEPIMSDLSISENNKSTKPGDLSEAAQAQINQRMEVMVSEVFKPLVQELKSLFGSPEALLDFTVSDAKLVPNNAAKIDFLSQLSLAAGQSILVEAAPPSTADLPDVPDKAKKKKKKNTTNNVKKFGESTALQLNIECFHNDCNATAESWPDLETHLEECHGFTSLSQSVKASADRTLSFSPHSNAPKSIRERYAAMVSVLKAPNIKTIFIDDLIEGEEELERLRGSEESPEEPPEQLEELSCAEKDCNASVTSVTQLNAHLIHQHGILPHTCLVCNDVFDQHMYGSQLYTHSWLRHRNFTGDYCCQHCDQKFHRHSVLSEHIHLFHTATTVSSFDLNDPNAVHCWKEPYGEDDAFSELINPFADIDIFQLASMIAEMPSPSPSPTADTATS